ncbi:acetyl-CoA carboxylase biotin carboxyl carrier protein [Gluconacetobacter johannae]|uniref:Biotin carboxyl carrier protein of acetyl-CoA carboxylase n=1 Tax=Gluconacetobacter johannae TaxID=112140 RepID=A0A7W4J501_9PROT|nr:biotin/lipoyl-containing protein [Gluconacetobacter johannae]MBB2174835.1 acetyl-CoA carboxylase biotin carboxyl carrier protein subunit [Gluconacetobacter johannae]
MDILRLKRLIDLFAHAPITELEIEDGGQLIRISRGNAGGAAPVVVHRPTDRAETATVPEPPPAAPAEEPRVITAPTYGVLHLSPSPGTPPYVTVGQDIEAGQQVGLVEAMKVFNAVKATLSGQIVEILVQDGAEVEAGSPLFRLK